MKKNAIMFSKIDREDGWVSLGLVFKVENTKTYEDAYNEIKHKLDTPEMGLFIIEQRDLLYTLFEENKTYKFVNTYWNIGLYFVFINEHGEELEYKLSADFVYVSE